MFDLIKYITGLFHCSGLPALKPSHDPIGYCISYHHINIPGRIGTLIRRKEKITNLGTMKGRLIFELRADGSLDLQGFRGIMEAFIFPSI
jgi:hypothetical protein